MVFLIETVEFMPLKLEFPFDAEKLSELHPVTLHNNSHWETKVFKLLLQISGLHPDWPLDTQERFALQHFIDAIKDQDDRLRLLRDIPHTLDEALLLAYELWAISSLGWRWVKKPSKGSLCGWSWRRARFVLSSVGHITFWHSSAITTSGDSVSCPVTVS